MPLAGTIILVLQDPAASFSAANAVIEAEGEVVYESDAEEALKRLTTYQIDAAVLEAVRCSEKLIHELKQQFIPFLEFGSHSPDVGNAVVVDDAARVVPALSTRIWAGLVR